MNRVPALIDQTSKITNSILNVYSSGSTLIETEGTLKEYLLSKSRIILDDMPGSVKQINIDDHTESELATMCSGMTALINNLNEIQSFEIQTPRNETIARKIFHNLGHLKKNFEVIFVLLESYMVVQQFS